MYQSTAVFICRQIHLLPSATLPHEEKVSTSYGFSPCLIPLLPSLTMFHSLQVWVVGEGARSLGVMDVSRRFLFPMRIYLCCSHHSLVENGTSSDCQDSCASYCSGGPSRGICDRSYFSERIRQNWPQTLHFGSSFS